MLLSTFNTYFFCKNSCNIRFNYYFYGTL